MPKTRMERAWTNPDFVHCISEHLGPNIQDEWLRDVHADPEAEAWLHAQAHKIIKQGHAINTASLQRMRAIVRPLRQRILPEAGHRLELIVEMCSLKRPSATLKGNHEQYVEASDRLMEAFQAKFGAEWEGRCAYRLNAPPAKLPHSFLSGEEALRLVGRFSDARPRVERRRPRPHCSGPSCAVSDFLAPRDPGAQTVREDLRQGRQAVTRTAPPGLVSYPRLGALEVTALLLHEGDRLVARECVFSKLLSRKWPAAQRVMARVDAFVQDAMWREAKAAGRADRCHALAPPTAAPKAPSVAEIRSWDEAGSPGGDS